MDPAWVECMYCTPGAASAGQAGTSSVKGKTLIETGGSAATGQGGGLIKGATLFEGGGPSGTAATPPKPSAPAASGGKKKTLFDPGVAPASQAPAPAARTSGGHLPRLAGWLVTFSHDQSGADYRLREGRNTIGADPSECEVAIIEDPSISSKHAVVMIRGGKLQIRDNDSTNGTFVNGEDIFGEASKILKNLDRVKFGSTECLLVMLPHDDE